MDKTITKHAYDVFEGAPGREILKYRKGDDYIQTLPDGRRLVSYEMVFTGDERDALNRHLGKFDAQSVERFTSILEELCRAEHKIFNSPKCTDSDVDRANAELLNVCKKAVKSLQKVSSGKRALVPLNKLNYSLEQNEIGTITRKSHNNTDVEWWGSTILKAGEARRKLLDFIECFDQRPPAASGRAGRPKGDDTGFVKEIAAAYALCFGIAATEYSTIFHAVVLFALEATGHRNKDGSVLIDATRKIRDALSSP